MMLLLIGGHINVFVVKPKLTNFFYFGLMINCFSLAQAEYNRVSPGSGRKICYFQYRSKSGAKDNVVLRGQGAKNLAPQDSNLKCTILN